jgi:transposase
MNPSTKGCFLESTMRKASVIELDGGQREMQVTLTHDYKRNGTTTLFAAMSTLDGTAISRCEQRHRHVEWLDFLPQINRETPPDKTLHLICDNYSTHKHPKVKEWLAKHPRIHVHFTPTSASWLNRVERFFRDITTQRLRNGVFRRVPELTHAIHEYIAVHNQNPKPFVWTAKANDILAKVIRANRNLSSKQNEALHKSVNSTLTRICAFFGCGQNYQGLMPSTKYRCTLQAISALPRTVASKCLLFHLSERSYV